MFERRVAGTAQPGTPDQAKTFICRLNSWVGEALTARFLLVLRTPERRASAGTFPWVAAGRNPEHVAFGVSA